jgi:hypothetical protein
MIAALVLMSAAAMADDDPPSRVARLQYMSGQVSLQPGGVNDWVPGVLNRPLTTADRVWTDKESKAELDLGSAALRAGSETSVTLTNVSDNTIQVELDQGTLDLRVRRLYDGETYEIDTPNLAFTILRAGEYRLDVDPNSDLTVVTVWRGQGEATGEGRSVRIKGDRQARFTNGTSLEHQMTDDPDRDGFDDWCRVRNRRQDYSESARYVSPDVIGAEDLDRYGRWEMTPSYGAMWVPAVAPGWAPYHYGHWAWIEPWGWTWVDDAPWGFAPFHYGRWVYDDGYWGWVPGPRVERPVYAPALVAWVGGGGVSVGISVGEAPTVGWFPLGYGEPYLPPYGGSRNYFQQVNVSNTRITNITQVTNNYYVNNNNTTINRTTVVNNNTTNVVNNNTTVVNNNVHNNIHNNVHIRYANENVPGALTAVPATALAGSQPVAQAALRVPPGQWKREQIAVAPPVAPSRASVLGARAGAPAVAPPARVITRQVVMKAAAPPRPIPFSMKQEALQHNPGRPLDRDTEQALRTRVARQQVNQPGRVAQQEPFGRPGNSQPAVNQPQARQEMQQERGFRGVPQPPARQQVQQQQQEAGRGVPHPPVNRGEVKGEQMAPQYRQVPRPPQQGSGQQPGFRTFGSPQAQPHSAAQPAAQENRPQPGFRSFESQQGQGHSVPRPPQNQGVAQPNNRGVDNPGMQPRSEGNRPSAAPQYDRGNQGSPAARPSYSRPNSEPARVEPPASRSETDSGGGREAHSQPSGPQHKEQARDNNKDKQH